MKASYSAYAGFTPAEESDIMIRLRVLAGEIYQEQANADYIKRQLFPMTAEGEYLDRHAAERGLTRRAATTASGRVLFYPEEETHGDIMIPAGTVVATYTGMRRFVTDSDAILHSSDSQVLVNVTAEAPGAAYNARGGTITVIVTPVLGIGRVYNGSVFNNGADEESDDELRARVIDSYVNVSNGANAAYYRRLALSVEGVYSASVVGRGRGNGTVDVYISGRGSEVPATVKNRVQELLDEYRELNTDVLARDPEEMDITLYIQLSVVPGYSFSTVSAEVQSAVEDYIDALGIGQDVLLSKIGEVIYHIEGVQDFRFVESYGSDTLIPANCYPVADNIIVREV
jgi:uncharacterized phage protein gp47/JayE